MHTVNITVSEKSLQSRSEHYFSMDPEGSEVYTTYLSFSSKGT